MLKFLDGPAAGQVLTCARSPLFLRVVIAAGGHLDALDQLADTPGAGERIHVYRLVADHGSVHYHGRDRHGKRFGRWEQSADYCLHDVQPDEAVLRSTEAWRAWATGAAAALRGGQQA